MSDLAIVLVVAAGTLAIRASLVTVLADATLPPRLTEALRLVAPAVLAGLFVQGLLLDGGAFRTDVSWYAAAAAAAATGWATRSVTWTLLSGMTVLWVIDALL